MNKDFFPKLVTGTILSERYEITGVISEGNFGRIYRVTDSHLPEKALALKEIFSTEKDNSEKAVENFRKEASLLSSLKHKNIPRIIDYFSYEERHYILMEYVSGESLYERYKIEGRFWEEDEIINFALEICNVLEYLHDKSIIFQTLTPHNIMIDDTGIIKLVGFPIIRHFKSKNIFTPGYAAPEHYSPGYRGNDPRIDIYSIGAILHYLATGENPEEKIEKFKFSTLIGISEKLSFIINKCTNVNKEDRFYNIKELINGLKEISLKKEITEFKLSKIDKEEMSACKISSPPDGSGITAEVIPDDIYIINLPSKGLFAEPSPSLSFFYSIKKLFSKSISPEFTNVVILLMFGQVWLWVWAAFLITLITDFKWENLKAFFCISIPAGIIGTVLLFFMNAMLFKTTLIFDRFYLKIRDYWLGIIPRERIFSIDKLKKFFVKEKYFKKKEKQKIPSYISFQCESEGNPVNFARFRDNKEENEWICREINHIVNYIKNNKLERLTYDHRAFPKT